MAKIAVIEDDGHILELVRFNLEKEGHQVISAMDGEKALQLISDDPPDLVILDLMLPKMDGLEVCRALRGRSRSAHLPIVMLTAKGEEVDKVLGLEMGADDYITKPFSPRELTARVKALLRRVNRVDAQVTGPIQIGELHIDAERYEVLVNGRKQDLTPKEFELLRWMAARPGKVFTREFLLERIWGYDFYGDSRTVDVHIRHLRQKIEQDPANPQYIDTVRGVGYKFRAPSV
ncbi:response regulator transcription factor [Heliophilum fasciatum]|uniref:Stage 0 sporulation protein A homolog n=1 Tax=Heliophilum fasciatum TaxID=35700 RepID=A0A4R2RIZ3_9FIRM|nr:response regulator transcription factor [Heliophilum fasciatum]MCW2278871.1 two-component system alkaline phosphatase synthesis response regulator PhoP [Heliophilum fasciatum]TCP62117.1 two-component system alkaline phosphatase synthesis response regulator PhoP [Heliophilum fasciatum]